MKQARCKTTDTHVYTCTHIYMHTYINTRVDIYAHRYTHVCVVTYMLIYKYKNNAIFCMRKIRK